MNATNISMTSATLFRKKTDVVYSSIVISGVLVIFSVTSLGVLIKAPRIANNIRYMCCNIIFYDICLLITFALRSWTMDNPKWSYFRASGCSLFGRLLAVTGFSVERLVAINSPYMYRKYFRTKTVKVFISVNLLCFTTIFISSFRLEPTQTLKECWLGISVYTTLSIICFVCNLKALIIFRQSLSRLTVNGLTNRRRFVNRSKTILCVFCLFSVLLHMPQGIEILSRRCEIVLTEHMYTMYVVLLNTAIDPLIYTWRFRECRLQGLKCLSQLPCFSFLRSTVEARRMIVFNIHVAERRVAVDRGNSGV